MSNYCDAIISIPFISNDPKKYIVGGKEITIIDVKQNFKKGRSK